MTNPIDYISVNSSFGFQLKDNFLSFWFKPLPSDVHITISFDSRTPDLDLHITKNVSNPKDKPKISIFRIERRILNEDEKIIVQKFLRKILVSFNIVEYCQKHNNMLLFTPYDKLFESEIGREIEKYLFDSFVDLAKIKSRTRLKIKGDVEKKLEEVTTSEKMQSLMYDSLENFDQEKFLNSSGGTLLSTDGSIVYPIVINRKAYLFKTDLQLIEMFTPFINEKLAKRLFFNLKKAIVRVKNAEGYEDTRRYNNPIRIGRNPKNFVDEKN